MSRTPPTSERARPRRGRAAKASGERYLPLVVPNFWISYERWAEDQVTPLTLAQYRVLHVLGRSTFSSAQLARELTVTPQAMVGAVKALHAKGFISRRQRGGAGHVIDVTATQSGLAAYATARRRLRSAEKRLFTNTTNLADAVELDPDQAGEMLVALTTLFHRARSSVHPQRTAPAGTGSPR